MKKQPYLKTCSFITTFLFSSIALIFNNSCNKYSKNPVYFKVNEATTEIIYVDVSPDSIVVSGADSANHYDLDLNNDGIADFTFSVYSVGFTCSGQHEFRSYVTISPADANGIVDSISLPRPMDSLSVISDTVNSWSNDSNQVLRSVITGLSPDPDSRRGSCYGGVEGKWIGQTKFLGLKLVSGGNTYYGWARVSVVVNTTAKLTILDYAYNSRPNRRILSGQTK